MIVLALAVLWAAGANLLLRSEARRHDARVARVVEAAQRAFEEARRALVREARLLGEDPAVAAAVGGRDRAALARTPAGRRVAVDGDREPGLVLLVDAGGAPVLQVPAGLAPAIPGFPALAAPTSITRVIDGSPWVLGLAPVRSSAEGPRRTVGAVVVGRRLEGLLPGSARLVALAGDRLPGDAPADLPREGWTAAMRLGSIEAGGERWALRPFAPADRLWILVSEEARVRERRRLWGWVLVSFGLALAGTLGAAWLVGPRRGAPSRLPRPPREPEPPRALPPPGEPKAARRLEALTRLTQMLTATLSLDEVLQRVVDAAVELFGSSESRLWLVDGGSRDLVMRASSGARPDAGRPRFAHGEGIVGTIVATRRPLVIDDLRSDPRVRNVARVRAEGLAAVAGVPLLLGARVLGALTIAVRERHQYTAEDVEGLQSLANYAAIAIENARLFTDEKARRAELASLLEINKKIAAAESAEALLGAIAQEAARLLGVDNAGFRLLEGDDLVVAGLAGRAAETMIRPRLKIGESLSGKVVAEGRTLVTEIDRVDVVPEHLAADRRLGYTMFLGVPLRLGDRIIGALTFRARRPFTERDRELAEAFADQASIAIEHMRLYREASQQAERLAALVDAERVLSETLDPDAVGQRVVESVRTFLDAQLATLYRLDPDSGGLVALAGSAAGNPRIRPVPLTQPGTGLGGLAVRERRPQTTANLLEDARLTYAPEARASLERAPYRSALAVPLIVRDRLIGVLTVADRPGRVFGAEEVRLAGAFADQAALALENARLHVDTERRRREAEELARLAGTLTERLEVAAVGERIVERVVAVFGAYSSALRLLRPDGSLVLVAGRSLDRHPFEPGSLMYRGEGIVGRAVGEGRPVWSRDVTSDPRVEYADPHRGRLLEAGQRAILAVPMRAKGSIIGALVIAHRAVRDFAEGEVALAQAFADQAALALENARLHEETERRRREAEELARLAGTLTERLEVAAVGQRIVESVLSLFRATSSWVRLLQADGALQALAHGGAALEYFDEGDVLPPAAGVAGRAVREGRAIWTPDVLNDPGIPLSDSLRDRVARSGDRAFLAVPLRVKGQIIGALTIADAAVRGFDASEVALAQAFADQAALALENARLHEETEHRRREAEVVADVARTINASLDLDTVLQQVVEAARELCGSDTARIALREAGSDRFTFRYSVGPLTQAHDAVVVEPGKGTGGQALLSGAPFRTDNYLEDPRISRDFVEIVRAEAYVAEMVVPIGIGERVEGLLYVDNRAPRPFTERDEAILARLADHAAIAIQNARFYEALEMRAARLRALARLNQAVSSTLEMDTLIAEITRAAATLMNVPVASFWVADEAARTLVAQTFSDPTLGADFPAYRLGFDAGGVGWVATHRQLLNVADVFTDGRFRALDWWRWHGLQSFVGVPVLLEQRLLAVLALNGRLPIELSAGDRDLLDSLVAQAAIAIRNARLYLEARDYAERLRALDEVSRLVSSSLEVEEVLRNTAAAVARFLDAPYVTVWVLDAGATRLRRALAIGDASTSAELPLELAPGEGGAGWAVLHREPIFWVDCEQDSRIISDPELLARGLRYFLAYPIAIGDRVLGAFAVNRGAPSPVTPETASILASLASQAAVALDHARLYAETTHRLEQTRALLEVAEILNSTLDPKQLLKRATIKIAQVCRVDRCTLERWDGERLVALTSQFADGHADRAMWEAFTRRAPLPLREVPAQAQAMETRRPVVILDCARTDQIPREWVEAYRHKSCLVVPLTRQDQVIGLLTLDYCERVTPFEPWQVELATAIAGQLALSLENARLYAEAQERLHETTTLVAVARVLSQPAPLEESMRLVARETARAFGADTAIACVADPLKRGLRPVAGYHVPKHLVTPAFAQRLLDPARYPAWAEALKGGRAIQSSDVLNDPLFDPGTSAGLPPCAVLFAPALAHGELTGGLVLVWWQTGRAFTPAEVRLVEGVAAQVGLALENAELARQTQVKLRETETLLLLSRTLSSTLDLDTLLRQFLRQIVRAIDGDSVGIWMVSEDGEWIEPTVGYHVPSPRLEAARTLRLSVSRHPFYAEAVRTRRPVFTSNASADPRVPRFVLQTVPHRSQLFAPIFAKDRLVAGFVAVWWDRTHEFSEGELALVEAIAGQTGVALENARLFQQNRRQVEELSVLYELSRAVTGQLDRQALLDALRTLVPRVLDANRLVVLLVDDNAEDVEVALRIQDGRIQTDGPRRYPRSVGLASVVLDTLRPLRTDDYVGECLGRGIQLPDTRGPRCWIGVPMTAGGTVLGVLTLSRHDRGFTDADERVLVNIADLAALALRSARLFEERTRAYGELAAAQDHLVRTEKLRALGEMASGVAHDFNNLLAAILGRAQLLLRRVEDPKLREWLQVIERSALDGAQTVRRLQEFARVRRDQPRVPVDLAEIVRETLEITQSRWREEALRRGVAIQVRTELGAVPRIAGDPAELREALTNLILNAVDAMPDGGLLTLATRLGEAGVELTVSDTGVGIQEEIRAKIFDPFFTTKGPRGTGLGLSMTYGILARHGARITVESEEGRGTTFRLTFPAPDRLEAEAPGAGGGAQAAARLRCLVVDDERVVGEVVGDVLEAAGHSAVVINDGARAIERFRAEPFDVVFTDLAMPGLTGWQVADAVRAVAPQVPVFVITGFGAELTDEERQAHGVEAVFAKPLRIDEVMEALVLVERRRLRTSGGEDRR